MKNLTEKVNQVNENMSKDKLWTMYEKMRDTISAETMCDEIARSMSADKLKETLEWIDRNYDLNIFR